MSDVQSFVDAYYHKHGPCCAGCDHWRFINSVAGECLQSKIVGFEERGAMLGVSGFSKKGGAGHAITPRNHVCANFTDTHEWAKP